MKKQWIIVALIIDRLSKLFAINFLVNRDTYIFNGLNLTLSFNRGISFGLFRSDTPLYFWLLTASIIGVFILFCFHIIREYKLGTNITPELFVFTGGISNLFDRFLYTGVVDFIDCYIGSYHWYTFNLADVYIVLGILTIFLREFYVDTGKN